MSWYDNLIDSSSTSEIVVHPKLGNIKFEDEGWWRGTIESDLGPIDILVRGTDRLVDEAAANYCFDVASNLNEYYQKAVDLFSTKLEVSRIVAEQRFKLDSLSSISRDREKSFFYMCFDDCEDEYAIWRVQFDNENATFLTRDS